MNSLKIIIRFIKNNKYTFTLNFIGITLGLTATMIIVGIVYQEYNYDQSIPNAKNIYRLIHKTENGWDFSTTKPLAPAVIADLPEIQNAFRFYPWYGYLACIVDEKKFTEKNVIFTDSSFISILELPMLYGDINSAKLSENSVLLSKVGATRYFGDSNPLGKNLKIGKDKLFTVTGVYEGFSHNSNFKGDVILNIAIIHKLTQVYFPDDWNHNSEFSTFVAVHERADISKLGDKIHKLYKQNSTEKIGKYKLQSLNNIHTNKEVVWESVSQINVNYLYLLLSVAAIIFIMSIANFNILYITTSSRRETGVLIKKVFGATKWKLFFEYLKEIWMLMISAIILSCFLMVFYNRFIAGSYQYLPELQLSNKYWILFGILVASLILCSLIPTFWLTSKNRINLIVKKQSNKSRVSSFTNYIVTFQFAFCVLLIFSALVIQKQSDFLGSFDIGYERDELITIPLNMHLGEGIYNERLEVFCDEIKNHSGVKNITLGFSSPALVQTSHDKANWEGKTDQIKVDFYWNAVYHDYFETIGIDIIKGRSFNRKFANDFDYNSSFANYILNQKAIEEMGIDDPIGKTFSQYGFKGQIVGVVKDFHFTTLHDEINPMAFSMNPLYFNEIIIRIDSEIKPAIEHIKETWNKFVPYKLLEINYVSSQLEANYEAERKLSRLLMIFTTIAIVIAILGLITLTISSTQERVKEIGIRKINGASVVQILFMFNKDFIKWVVIGFIIISPVGWYLMNKWLDNFAFKTNLDVWLFFLTGAIVLLLASITISFQSFKAATRNPVDALRND